MTPPRYQPFLSEEQASDLAAHLSRDVPEDLLPDAVATLDYACKIAAVKISVDETQPGAVQRDTKRTHQHFTAMLEAAAELQKRLAIKRPIYRTADIEWSKFDATLAAIIEAAKGEQDATSRRAGRGRPSMAWRDDLVAAVFSVYPPGTAKKHIGSAFEVTVEMLLGYLGQDIQNVHGLILKALRRRPEPPFSVRVNRPLRK